MLLRRIIDHVKAQNWTAVALDFLIVVVGVFIGIQVSNWNGYRQERQVERRVLERLQKEAPALIATRSEQREFATFRKDALEGALRKLFSEQADNELTQPECLSVTLSHIYVKPTNDLPVIEELLATGRLDIIREEGVRAALLDVFRARNQSKDTQAAVTIDIHQLGLEYPDLIESGYVFDSQDTESRTRSTCNTAGMRANQQFLNTLVSNHQRFLNYYEAQFESVDPKLDALLAALEEAQ